MFVGSIDGGCEAAVNGSLWRLWLWWWLCRTGVVVVEFYGAEREVGVDLRIKLRRRGAGGVCGCVTLLARASGELHEGERVETIGGGFRVPGGRGEEVWCGVEEDYGRVPGGRE